MSPGIIFLGGGRSRINDITIGISVRQVELIFIFGSEQLFMWALGGFMFNLDQSLTLLLNGLYLYLCVNSKFPNLFAISKSYTVVKVLFLNFLGPL